MTRKDDKGDQPSGGETTWTNTGATPYGRDKVIWRRHADAFAQPWNCIMMMIMMMTIVWDVAIAHDRH